MIIVDVVIRLFCWDYNISEEHIISMATINSRVHCTRRRRWHEFSATGSSLANGWRWEGWKICCRRRTVCMWRDWVLNLVSRLTSTLRWNRLAVLNNLNSSFVQRTLTHTPDECAKYKRIVSHNMEFVLNYDVPI